MVKAKRRGRPTKPKTQLRSNVISIRVRDVILESLEAAATAAGRTVSQEVQIRLDRTFERQGVVVEALETAYGRQLTGFLLVLAQALDSTGPYAAFATTLAPDSRATWLDNPFAYDEAMKAVIGVMEGLRSAEKIEKPLVASVIEAHGGELGIGVANSILNSIAGRPATRSQAEFADQVRPLLGGLADNIRDGAKASIVPAITTLSKGGPK